ncbi:MAG: ferric enterobactin receptor [Flavobacteriales bacterium]|jgi:ferric enterobactin receptor
MKSIGRLSTKSNTHRKNTPVHRFLLSQKPSSPYIWIINKKVIHLLNSLIMKLQFFFFLFCLVTSTTLLAQNTINGQITDNNNKGIYFATIALYHATDSTVIQSGSTDKNGRFSLSDDIPDGNYYLKANMLGYTAAQIQSLEFPKEHNKSVSLQLEEDATMLSTIEVTAKVPLLEQRSDRLVVNVENNLSSMNGNVMDVMKLVPGMIVIGDKLSMAGQPNITILINGKTTQYMDVQSLLREMPGDNIKKVEVIHQPGAEFEAAGTGAIINIILKKNSLYGTNGTLSLGAGKGEFYRYRGGLSLSHYQGKLNVNGNIGYSRNTDYDQLIIQRRINGDVYNQHNIDPSKSGTFRSGLSMDYNLTDRQSIGFSSRFFTSQTDKNAENNTIVNFLDTENQDLNLTTTNDTDSEWNLIILTPYYSFEIDTLGQKLDFDLNYAKFNRDGLSVLQTVEQNVGNFFGGTKYDQPGSTRIFSSKLDYNYPLNKEVSIQTGLKYSDAKLDNDLKAFQETSENVWEENAAQSNHFIFDESIMAAYGKMSFNSGDWSGTAGLRYEISESKGTSETIDSTLTRDIKKLFPSASLQRKITKELAASVAYSYRIDRPRYSSLNPFVYYWDPYTFEAGNPLLRPALTHSMKFNLSYESQPFFNIEYKRTKDAMVDFTEQDDESGSASATVVNVESLDNFSTSLFFPLSFIPGLDGYGGAIASNTKYFSEKGLPETFNPTNWSITAVLQIEFTLPGKINTEIGGWYNSGEQEGIMAGEWLYGVSLGLSKKILQDKGKISIGMEDVFRKYWTADIQYANMDADVTSKWAAPVVNMQFRYTFGNQHMKKGKRNRNSGSEEIRRAQ